MLELVITLELVFTILCILYIFSWAYTQLIPYFSHAGIVRMDASESETEAEQHVKKQQLTINCDLSLGPRVKVSGKQLCLFNYKCAILLLDNYAIIIRGSKHGFCILQEVKTKPVDGNIVKEAMIYGKNNNQATLDDYQKAINKAAGQLTLAEPGLLTKRGKTIFQTL